MATAPSKPKIVVAGDRSGVPRTEPTLVATYRREVGASLARVWENVLDWEHLPWLHRSTFRDFRVRDDGRDRWSGWLTTQDGRESLIDTRLDRPSLCYLVATLDGAGRGSEILTRLEPRSEHVTGVAVEFRIPDVDPELAERIGAAYVAIYERLWDEDEGMMQGRERRAAARGEPLRERGAISLGPEQTVRARLPFVVDAHGTRYRIVDVGGTLYAHSTVCPHLGGPLEAAEIEHGIVRCPWHGYRFDVATGRNADGRACALDSAPRIAIEPETREAHLVWDTGRHSQETQP